MEKLLFCWSSGKDSALALHEAITCGRYEVVALLTTMTEAYDRVSMHGVRRVLVEGQAKAIGLPLDIVWIPKDCSNDSYESAMRATLEKHKSAGVSRVGFGDLFLEDLKKYREEKLTQVGMEAVFPLWMRNTTELAREFTDMGFKATITCVDTQALDGSFSGRDFDKQFLSDLPSTVDPCGENGEFHSFAWDGPIFKSPVEFSRGEVVLREDRYRFCDLVLG